MGTSNYEKLTDEQLIRNLRDGDKKIMDYIMEKYKNVVRKEAKAMYLIGGENDDLIQEALPTALTTRLGNPNCDT